MDFGDILNDWNGQQKAKKENREPQISHKKLNAPTKDEKELARQGYVSQKQQPRANPMNVWLNRYGTVDKDKVADEAYENQRLESRDYLKDLRPEAFVDLHGLTRDEAWEKLREFIADSRRRGLKKVLIIHGKGNHSTGSDPVLGQMVNLFIEQDKGLGASGHPTRNHGGNGATWVILK